jgi:glucosyl-3-phosphoglycerate synthase
MSPSKQLLWSIPPVPTPILRTWHHAEFSPARLCGAKGGHTVSVCLPARDEAATIGAIVRGCRAMETLVDEIVVIDDGSSDDTLGIALAEGARGVRARDVLPECGAGQGKGEALWKSLHVAKGDLIVWCDADVQNFAPAFVAGLLGPLLLHDDVALVKGFYARPLDGRPGEGGRVTELVARPLIELLFPELAAIVQPLAGECAGRREILEQLPFVQGYGVDLALLVDAAELCGVEAIAQVDLGERVHRNRPLTELAAQARAIMATAFERAALDIAVDVTERPAMLTVPSYRQRAP